jgi:hypothetical protein
VEQEEEAIAKQDVSAATNEHTTIKEMLEAAFYLWSALRLHSEYRREG